MFYAYWFIGLLFGISFAVVMACAYELKGDGREDD